LKKKLLNQVVFKKTPLVLLALLFFVFALWAQQKDQPPANASAPEAKAAPEAAAKATAALSAAAGTKVVLNAGSTLQLGSGVGDPFLSGHMRCCLNDRILPIFLGVGLLLGGGKIPGHDRFSFCQ